MSVMLSRVLFANGTFSVTLALKTVFPNQEHSLPSKNCNFSNDRQFVCLAVTCFFHALCCDAECAYCRRHASLLLRKFMGFLNFRVE